MNRAALVICLLLAPVVARPLAVEGKTFEPTVTVEGRTLKLVGAGLRQKWMFNVYAMGAYSESGACDANALVNKDEPKSLRLELLRDVSAEKMASTIGGSFDEHMPKDAPAELKAQRAAFQGYFKDECSKGSSLEFVYVPGIGTILKQNGKQLGAPLAGQGFARVLWEIYFGEESCCSSLKRDVLKCGK